jgi:hypothetical protein
VGDGFYDIMKEGVYNYKGEYARELEPDEVCIFLSF